MIEVPATNCPGRLNVNDDHIEVFFSCIKKRILPEKLDNFKDAVKAGKDKALNGCTIVFTRRTTWKKFLGLTINGRTQKEVRIYVQPSVDGSDLMIVNQKDLEKALQMNG